MRMRQTFIPLRVLPAWHRPARNNSGPAECENTGRRDNKLKTWVFVVMFLLLAAAACRNDPESPGAKSENSALVAMMLRHRSETVTKVSLYAEMGYHFLCVPSNGDKVWIMLDARYAPYYKQQPWDQNFFISKADFQQIQQSKMASAVVIRCLASHLQQSEAR